MRNLEEFNGVHLGKPAFIVGSGPTIAYENLLPLKEHITIAVNSGYVAAPWATYFLSDDQAVAKWSYFGDLKNTPTTVLLYEDKLADQAVNFGDRAVLFRHRSGYKITPRYCHDDRRFRICQARTSIGSAIHVAHIMGCSPVVLLGVDCCWQSGHRYFWEIPLRNATWKDRIPYRIDREPAHRFQQTRLINKVSDTDLGEICKYWRETAMQFNKKVKVINASQTSILNLFKCFPHKRLSEILEESNV